MKALVSVIIPNYNYAAFLKERLDSVLEQTYRNIEVIILDDCSTDHSLDIMHHYQQADPRIIQVVESDVNSGSPYHQWLKGIRMARGKYIWIAEADDVADVRLLEKAVEELEHHAQAVLVQVDSLLIDDDGQTLKKDIDHWKRNHITEGQVDRINGKEYVQKQMYWKNRIYNASGVVVKRECITEQVIATLVIPHISDWVFWSAIAMQGDIIQVHERLNRFRQHASSLTHSKVAHVQGATNEAQVVRMLQEMVPIPYLTRLRRIRKICNRYHSWGLIREVASIVLK